MSAAGRRAYHETGAAPPTAELPIASRRVFLATATAAALLGSRPGRARAAEVRVVEDWSRQTLGAQGTPAGWQTYETPGGRPRYDFTVVDDGGRRALRLRSADEHSTIAKDPGVDLLATPILEWAWKVVAFPAGVDLRRKAGSDATGHLLVVWPRFPALLRSRVLAYVWDPGLPAGTMLRSAKTSRVTYVVVRSGTTGVGEWRTERRNVRDDYRAVYAEEPDPPGAIALSIDTNDTRAPAEALIGAISFRAPG